MGNEAPSGAKVDRLIEAEPIEVEGRRIQPVARLIGWETGGDGQNSPFAARAGRLMPVEVRIDDGEEQAVIPMDDPSQEPIRGILSVAATVTAVCILIMLVAQIAARRR